MKVTFVLSGYGRAKENLPPVVFCVVSGMEMLVATW